MADTNIAGGVPMSLEQMREYLQEHYGVPIALREQGANTVQCPYCHGKHHATETGHQEARCEEDNFGSGIVIGNRYFIKNYGYTVAEYIRGDKTNQLVVSEFRD